MIKFISINTFSELFGSHSDLLSEEGIQFFKEKLIGPEGQQICLEKNILKKDFDNFVLSLADPSTIVYQEWVLQNKPLLALFEKGIVMDKFTDQTGQLKHHLIENYKRYLSPYLSETLLQFKDEKDIEKVSKYFSFCQLLDNDHRALVESQFFKVIQERLDDIKSRVSDFDSEQELIELVQPVCSDDFINCVNYLSKSSYALKLDYVDEVLNVLRTKACTVRFANWVLKRMALVTLNKEHENKLADIRQELKRGELKVKNQGRGSMPIRWKNVRMTFLLVLIAVFVGYVIYYKPFSDVKDPQFTNNTSFKQFTKDERKKIDSLLQKMNGNARKDDIIYDQGIPLMGSSSTLTLRKSFENSRMEQLYADLIKDADLQEGGYIDSCETEITYKRLAGVKDINSKKGSIEAMIKNESEYDVVLFVCENRKGGGTYSMLINEGETEVFTLDRNNLVFVVPGNNYQNFHPPKNVSKAERPSDKYDFHFCDTDVNYKESINTIYEVMHLQKGKAKFMVMGDKGSYFHLIDINGILESF